MRLLPWLLVATALAAGACVEAPAPEELNALDVCVLANDGDLCDDHQPCTFPDRCLASKCVGTPVPDFTRCTDGNVCTTGDVCLSAVCVGTVVADGTSCTDGDPCTDLDVCQLGICQPGAPTICDDGDACTVDTCTSGIGCVFSPRECTMPVDASIDTLPDLGADAPSPDAADAPPEAGGADVGDVAIAVDTGRVDTGGGDTGGAEAGAAEAGATDAEADAGAGDAQPDARDAALDLVETPPDLRARGGGCQCTLGKGEGGRGADGPTTLAFALSLLVVLKLRRRRNR